MNSEFLDIILFALVAIFLIMRLKKILGSEKGKIINLKTAKSNFLKPKTTTKTTTSEPKDEFLEGANQAFSMIVEAYQANNTNKVQELLTEEAYKILNLDKNKKNSKDDINKAYIKIQKKIHPDVSPETARLSAIVNDAKEVILRSIS